MTALRGSCLCGGVRFEIDGPLMRSSHCHCRQCQKAHGAPFRTRARVAAADFRYLVGEGFVSFYESTPGTHRGFCKVCGSPVLVKFDEHSRSAQTDPGAVAFYGIALATLDDDPGIRPDAHAFIVDKAPWFTVTDDLPQYPARIPGQNAPHNSCPADRTRLRVRAATLSVRGSFGEGTFAGKQGNGRDAPLPAVDQGNPSPKSIAIIHTARIIMGEHQRDAARFSYGDHRYPVGSGSDLMQ